MGLAADLEGMYRQLVGAQLGEVRAMADVDIAAGLIWHGHGQGLEQAVVALGEGLRGFFPGKKAVIICVGNLSGQVTGTTVPTLALALQDERLAGKPWALRALFEAARELDVDLAVFDVSAGRRQVRRIAPEWIGLLLGPIAEGHVDLVVPRCGRYHPGQPVVNHFVHPLTAALYNTSVVGGIGAEFAISGRLLRRYLADPETWETSARGEGVDVWLLSLALAEDARVGQVDLGTGPWDSPAVADRTAWAEMVQTLFGEVIATRHVWEARPCATRSPLVFGPERPCPGVWPVEQEETEGTGLLASALTRLRESDWAEVLDGHLRRELQRLGGAPSGYFAFPADLWARTVYEFLLAYRFVDPARKGEVAGILVTLLEARAGGFAGDLRRFAARVQGLRTEDLEPLLWLQAERLIEEELNEFVKGRAAFLARWKEKEKALGPFLPKIGCWEFIPGVPLVLPQELQAPSRTTVSVARLYEGLSAKHREQFESFAHGALGVPVGAPSSEIAGAVHQFLCRVEEELDWFLPGDLSTVEGTAQVVNKVFSLFSRGGGFGLKPEVAARLLREHPPRNLMMQWGCADVAELLAGRDPLDVAALARWSEEPDYIEKDREWVREDARSEHFGPCAIRPVVVNCEEFPWLAEMNEASVLGRLTGRVVASSLRPAAGGEFPKLRYFVVLGKMIVEMEQYGAMWRLFAAERKEFGKRVINSVEKHWGKSAFSAHNVLENGYQRLFVERVRDVAREISGADDARLCRLGRYLNLLADSYHLALTLPDGEFVPCSAWTWTKYSFRGGKGIPTPLSVRVERDWFSTDLLLACYRAVGGTEEAARRKLIELAGQGREPEDLSRILLGPPAEPADVLLSQDLAAEQPRAGRLTRIFNRPILGPIPGHPWESKYVLNPGAVRLGGVVHLVYRAVGDDGVSRLGLALSRDGVHIAERLEEPIFEPENPAERMGCEDPRLAVIDGRVFMLYTAYDGVLPQIAMASISVDDMVDRRWEGWRRHGLVFPGLPNKDAVLFGEKLGRGYAMCHRIAPSMWLSRSDGVECPWPRDWHKILVGPRSGMMWDATKIGAGAQPIKTRFGWLLIYHGVDYAHVYRLGVIVTDLRDPARVLYRSPNAVLEPVEEYETGTPGVSWVPNVVFTCGAVPREEKGILDQGDEILVYYGAADTVIGVASGTVGDLIPGEVRERIALGCATV